MTTIRIIAIALAVASMGNLLGWAAVRWWWLHRTEEGQTYRLARAAGRGPCCRSETASRDQPA